MGLFKSIADVIFDKPRIDPYTPKQEMVEIEASELAWLRLQADQNPSRGRITAYPKEDRNDPEYSLFKDLLDGRKILTENEGMLIFNNWVKLRELLEEIVRAYHHSFVEAEELESLDSNWSDWSPEYTIDLDHNSIRVQWIKRWHEIEQEDPGGEFWMPREFLWSDWKKLCDEESARRKAIKDEEARIASEKYAKYVAEQQEEEYRRAKETIERTERAKDPGFRDWYHREGKRLHNNGRDMFHTYDVDRLYSIYAKVRGSVK